MSRIARKDRRETGDRGQGTDKVLARSIHSKPSLKLLIGTLKPPAYALSCFALSRLCRVIIVARYLRVRRQGQLVPRLMPALKGRDIPAQGNALGNEVKIDEP
jgi:hypothetical protein